MWFFSIACGGKCPPLTLGEISVPGMEMHFVWVKMKNSAGTGFLRYWYGKYFFPVT